MSGPRSSLSQCNAAGRAWAGSWAKSNKRLRMLDELHRFRLDGQGYLVRSPDFVRDGFDAAELGVGMYATEHSIRDQVEAFERGVVAWFEAYEAEHGPVAQGADE